MFRFSTKIIFLAILFDFSSSEKIADTDLEFKTLQDFSHFIHARAAQAPKPKNKFRIGQLRTTEKPLGQEDAKKYRTKIKSLLDMEYEALELEIKYFLTYLKDLIQAKKKESTEQESQGKSMPKTFYDYVHNPPDSVYIFIAVCIIVVFVLCIGIYILYLACRHYRRKRRERDVEHQATRDAHQKSKVSEKISGFKNKLSSIFRRKRKEERSGTNNRAKHGGKLQRKETLEDVILRTSEYESNADHDLDDLDLRAKLLRTGESKRIDQRLVMDRDRFR
ncbi:hypothetical protein AVEN_76532-1 [Araneus ventricosus]|uniref:Uncharacterized protein n=1 Tax=Araneus ventricosus TaxID=182803 RepID=A0A4Y2CEX9_ARAVE|nr:hypothetical protein AVEN_76532-1 [Araneus ventricosus]